MMDAESDNSNHSILDASDSHVQSEVTREQLTFIANLSYKGDVRNGFAEDPNKIEKIVSGS